MPREFDCCECGRHIIAIIADSPGVAFGLCCQCLSMPGWFRDPQLRTVIDPDHDGQDAMLTKSGDPGKEERAR
jgi:hypothetical protein